MTARDIALSQPDLAPVPVEVPEWGTTVYVRPLTGWEIARFYAGGGGDEALLDFTRRAVFVAADADGRPLFTEADLPALRAKPQSPFLVIASEGMKLNRMGVEAAKKDSPGTPGCSGNSDSAAPSDTPSPS